MLLKDNQRKLSMLNRHYVKAWEFNLKLFIKIPANEATLIIDDFFFFVASLFMNKGIKFLFKIATGKQLILIKSVIWFYVKSV